MSKKVLILSASPRKHGNSDVLCDRFADGARESGNQVEKIFLNDKKIGFCPIFSAVEKVLSRIKSTLPAKDSFA